jgi:magnesium chelatase subunit H
MRKPTSVADRPDVNVTIVTLDRHLNAAADRARHQLKRALPGLSLNLHAAADWEHDPQSLEACKADIGESNLIVASMLFMEQHVEPILPALQARRDHCDAMVGCMSAGEVVRLTRMGGFDMNAPQSGPLAMLKRLRGRGKSDDDKGGKTHGAKQMAMLRRLPRILRFVPGTAQDVRAYFLTLQYWLGSSDENLARMVQFLVNRYAEGDRQSLRGRLKTPLPAEYPDTGLYHPAIPDRITERLDRLPAKGKKTRGTVGLLVMRSYVLAGDTEHYDGVIEAFEKLGYRVIPAFASGLDAREAISEYFQDDDGAPRIDALVSLTGFSLVGGPAYNDADAAEAVLKQLDVPYIAATAVEFQSLSQWEGSERGLMPVESTMMVSIPELDGATGSLVYGGRAAEGEGIRSMRPHPERVGRMAERVDRLIGLRRQARNERRVAITLFSFPPNAGNIGTAAHLAVFESLHRLLAGMAEAGYEVEVPESVDALRERLLDGNRERFGADANVHHRIPADDHVAREPFLAEIEEQWGPAPGKQQADGRSIHVLGAQFGNVFVGIQPSFGYEGDPMRLLFEGGFAPTHAFSAYYRYLREDFKADAVLHFGTHGALEFMPGKHAGMSEKCWPDRLIGDLPNIYLYAANNPSEGTIAKRRSAATLVSYMTPPLAQAGLYRGMIDLRDSIDRIRQLDPESHDEREGLLELIQAQASELDMTEAEPAWAPDEADRHVARLSEQLLELEETLIPEGLHVAGQPLSAESRLDVLLSVAESTLGRRPPESLVRALLAGERDDTALAAADLPVDDAHRALCRQLIDIDGMLATDHELPALLHALDGGFVPPVAGGDVLRNPDVLPTGRNLHGFDPFRIPSQFAVKDGVRQAERLLARHCADGVECPESIAMVLWGTDNLKNEGGPIAQALALMGARPRFDGFGRLAGAELISLEELGRPRIDVVMTLSGIFRDLLPLQTRLLADAAWLAASADEPPEMNFLRRNALAYQQAHDCDLETAALRVFSNSDGTYGANVNFLLDNGRWDDGDELAETYSSRKCYAYGRDGQPVKHKALLEDILSGVQLSYQNLDSVELGVTTISQYFDTLGGISRAVKRASGRDVPVYISDQTRGEGKVRTLGEQVALETRTRLLNPKWHEGMLKHGYEGVRHLEEHLTNTMGWSATTGQVEPWVYQKITETFVLDAEMRNRLADLNPTASIKLANRLLEAQERNYWSPSDEILDALREAGADLEDRLENIHTEACA